MLSATEMIQAICEKRMLKEVGFGMGVRGRDSFPGPNGGYLGEDMLSLHFF